MLPRMRPAACVASFALGLPSSISRNSSPPARATMSRGPAIAFRRFATSRNTLSPVLCPKDSLTALRPSTLMNSKASRRSWRSAWIAATCSISSNIERLGRSVSLSVCAARFTSSRMRRSILRKRASSTEVISSKASSAGTPSAAMAVKVPALVRKEASDKANSGSSAAWMAVALPIATAAPRPSATPACQTRPRCAAERRCTATIDKAPPAQTDAVAQPIASSGQFHCGPGASCRPHSASIGTAHTPTPSTSAATTTRRMLRCGRALRNTPTSEVISATPSEPKASAGS